MNIQSEIAQFQQLLHAELDSHDAMLRDWETLDWHDRYVNIERMLHRMWALYDKADELSEYIRRSFPPYPFSEIKEIQRWLRDARHRLEDFMTDDYQPTSSNDYQDEYMKFLSIICDENQRDAWHQREAFIASKEQELLTMLQKSYSVILDMLLQTSHAGKNNPQAIQLSYTNVLARYEQLQWPKDLSLFQSRLSTRFPWNGPTSAQLQLFYSSLSDELSKEPGGKAYERHGDNIADLALALAEEPMTEEQLHSFFRRTHELAYLQTQIQLLQAQEAQNLKQTMDNRPPLDKTFTYLYRKSDLFDKLVSFLMEEAERADRDADADWARHALVIFDQNPTILQKRPHTFKKWLKDFCKLFGRKWVRDYEPEKLRKTVKKSGAEVFMPVKVVG